MHGGSGTLDEAILKVLPTNQREIRWMSTETLRLQLEERGHESQPEAAV